MGHLFGLMDIALSSGRFDARQSGSSPSTRRFFFIALGMAVAVILPISKAEAQAPAPSGEAEVQLDWNDAVHSIRVKRLRGVPG